MSERDGSAGRTALLDVLAGRKANRRPVWFMRQAGRYLPEYRKVRERAGSFLGLCYHPEWAAEVTLQPLRRFDLDALIIFSDILVVPHAMGLNLAFREGEGPLLQTVNSMLEVEGLKPVAGTPEVKSICETMRRVKADVKSAVPVFGFCGAPWTVATYMIEGRGTEARTKAKAAMRARAPWFKRLMERLVGESIDFLCAQCEAGADVLQVFDSWASDVPDDRLEEIVVGPLRAIRAGVLARGYDVPMIAFARGARAAHLPLALTAGYQGVSLESGVPARWAREQLSAHCVVQGNLDPLALTGPQAGLVEAVREIVRELPRQRHIFNLGHGIRPETDPAAIAAVIAEIRGFDDRSLS